MEGIDEGIVEAETLHLKDSVRLGYDIAGFSESILSDFIERNEVDLKGDIFMDFYCLIFKLLLSDFGTSKIDQISKIVKVCKKNPLVRLPLKIAQTGCSSISV